jgi:cysteine desulfurase/selenocysteine lyase
MIYLDNAATSYPKPEPVYAAMDDYSRHRAANPGRSGHRMAVGSERAIDDARHRLARFFGESDSSRLIFTLNCTDSLNIAIKGIVKPGDHVITSNLEHNSISRPLHGLQERGIISLTKVDASTGGYLDPSDIKKAIRHETKLIAITHASNVTGAVQPIAEIGRITREQNVFLLADAAQSAGAVDIDVNRDFIDMLAFPGHKSLFGPQGTGGLLVGERVDLLPWREGGTGKDSDSVYQPRDLPFRLEGGTPNSLGIVGLGAGVEFVEKEGRQKIHKREMELSSKLLKFLNDHEAFRVLGPKDTKNRVSAVAFCVQGLDPAEAGAILDETFEIAVRPGLHCAPYIHKQYSCFPEGSVRVSPGYFNTEEEIDTLITALSQITGLN